MKLSPFILLALTGALAANAAVTVVSGNVYDVGKYSLSKDEWIGTIEDTKDSNMCWAAAASNVIQYWQDTYHKGRQGVENGVISFGYTSPNGSGCLKVYKQFVTNWRNTGGTAMNAFSWWMQGKTPGGLNGNYYPDSSSLDNPAVSFGGHYTDIFGTNAQNPRYPDTTNAPFYSAKMSVEPGKEIAPKFDNVQSAIKKAFEHDAQAVVLDLKPLAGTGHAISCWGYETNEEGTITTLILSDSDDRKYGTFMVSLTENEDGYACIGTDRSRSDYHGNHAIADVVFINTPDTHSTELQQQASITSLASPVTSSGRLTQSATTHKDVIIGGGTYSSSNVLQAVLFTSADKANISIDGGQMQIKDGAMALLYGGLTIQNAGDSGVLADGHLYVHGGAVDIAGCESTESGGGIQATNTYGEELYAVAYVEMKGAGNINLSSNTSSTQAREHLGSGIYEYYNAGGGALYSADSLSIRDSGNITIEDNKAKGYNVHGGGAFAQFNTIINGNGDVSVSGNSTESTEGYVSYGGGIAGMYIDVSKNKMADFSDNRISITNENARGWIGTSGDYNVYQGGACAAGGAIAVHPFSQLSYYDMQSELIPVPTTLNMDGNSFVGFKNNSISVQYTGDISGEYGINNQPCSARGGAVYLGYDVVDETPVGTEASISRNQGDVTFSNNHASSSATLTKEDEAQGGAVYISKASTLTIDSNEGNVSFSGNSVDGTVAQGGAVYNAGKLAITHNSAVEFSNNTAEEGSHIYNEEGATAVIAWNGSVRFTADSAADSTVVNKGTMYLAAEQGKRIEFHNTTLNTTEGTLHLGKDATGTTSATTLSFTGDATASTPRTEVSSHSNIATDLSGLSLSVGTIAGVDKATTPLGNVTISTNTALAVKDMTLGSNVHLAETDKAHALTLSNVAVNLSETQCTTQENERGGTNYIFDLQSMLSGNITLDDITFNASDLIGTPDFSNKDSVCMMFGDVEFTQKDGTPITLSYVAQGGEHIQNFKLIGGSNVYFGEYFEVPEPATGTLSLLALTALAARRRKNRE